MPDSFEGYLFIYLVIGMVAAVGIGAARGDATEAACGLFFWPLAIPIIACKGLWRLWNNA